MSTAAQMPFTTACKHVGALLSMGESYGKALSTTQPGTRFGVSFRDANGCQHMPLSQVWRDKEKRGSGSGAGKSSPYYRPIPDPTPPINPDAEETDD